MTYAAFYIKNNKTKQPFANAKATQGIKAQIQNAYRNARNTLQNFDIKQMAQNINLQSATAFTQKYGVAALTMIVNQRPVTNQMMLDSLFNGIAPALGITAGQIGFNSIMEMKNAAMAGNINVANFMQGLSNGLSIVTDSATGQADYSKYGEEIPIDLTTSFSENHTFEMFDRRVQKGFTYSEGYHILPLILPVSGIIKDGKNFTAHEFADRLSAIADTYEPFTFRAGEKIYENYMFTNFNPTRQTEQGISFDAEIKQATSGDAEFVKVNIPRKKPATSGNGRGNGTNTARTTANKLKGQSINNKTSSQNYAGGVGAWQWLTGGDPVSNIPFLNNITKTLEKLKT